MSNPSGPRLPDSSGSLVDLFDPSRVIVTDPLMLMCDSLAIRGGATSTGRYCRAVKWGIASITQDVADRTASLVYLMNYTYCVCTQRNAHKLLDPGAEVALGNRMRASTRIKGKLTYSATRRTVPVKSSPDAYMGDWSTAVRAPA